MVDQLDVENNIKKQESRENPEIVEFFDCCLKSLTPQLEALLKRKSLIDLINGRDRNGRSLLHYCAECTGTLCASTLIKQRPNSIINQDNDGYTILHLAVINGNISMVTYLTSENVKTFVPESLFIQFLNSGDTEGHTAFHWATVCNEIQCLDILYSSGASASLPDIHGAHPVHYAAQMTAPANNINKDVRIGLKVLRKILSYQKVDPNCRDKDGRTPLLWAASSGSGEAIMMLVNSGADVTSCDKDGLTALHCASSRGHVESAEALINMCGAEIDIADSIGCSPLFYAVTLGHADCTQLLLESGAEPNRQDLKGRTAAHCGAAKGQFETIKILASHGANLWYRNVRGDLPLHEAIKSGRKELVRWLLQQLPSAVNTTNSIGRSPLHIAAADNNVEMCKVLIDSGSEINPLMKSKGHLMTPLDCALQKNYRSCAKFLLLHGALPASRLNLNSRSLNQKRSSSRSPGKGHVSPKVYTQAKSTFHDNCYSSVNSSSGPSVTTNMESVEQHQENGQTRTSISKRKVAVYRNNGLSPDYSYSTSQSMSSGFQSQSIITNVYVNTVSKHKMAPLKRIKRRSNLNTSASCDSSLSSSNLNEATSQVNGANSDKETRVARKTRLGSLKTKVKTTGRRNIEVSESEGSTSRSRIKSKGLLKDEVNDRLKSTSQSLDRATSKRGQINNNSRSLIGKSIVKHPHASDVDLSVTMSEQVINDCKGNDDNEDSLRRQIESSESIIDHKGASGSTSEADYSEDFQVEAYSNINNNDNNQETTESATGSLASVESLGSHELPPMPGSDDSSVDYGNQNAISEEPVPGTREMERNNVIIESNKIKSHQVKYPDSVEPNKQSSAQGSSKENDNSQTEPKFSSESRCSHRLHHRPLPNIGPIDLSHVTAKVDSRGLDLARRPHSEAKPTKEQIKSETNEMMARVERSLRKYQLERKIFQELQDLKRCQIRSGRVNEPVLVKRLIEKFSKDVKSPGMADFNDTFTYRAYERFLYDQLRKLSSSNQGKVLPIIKSVSDENLTLKLMKTSNGVGQFNSFSNGHHHNDNHNHHYQPHHQQIHQFHNYNNNNQHRHQHSNKGGLRQKSVSAMSSFNQSKFPKDAHWKEKFDSVENGKETVDSEKFKIEQVTINNNNNNMVTNKVNSDNKKENNSVIVKNLPKVKSDLNIENKKVEVKNDQQIPKEVKTISSDLKQGKDHKPIDKKIIKENGKQISISEKIEQQSQTGKAKSVNNSNLKEVGRLIVKSSMNDSVSPSTGKIDIKAKSKDDKNMTIDKRKQDKKEKKEPINQRGSLEVKKTITRGLSNTSIRKVRRTTAKHEQYKSLRGSHRRICLKSSDANSKPYIEAAINRPKFKRCKSSIPARFKVNIPLKEIERRWKLIKNAERLKSGEQSTERVKQSDENGEPLDFLLLYEINRARKVDDYSDDYDYDYEYGYDDDNYQDYHVHVRQDDASDHGTEYDYDDQDDHYHHNHLLKRTHSEPALLPRDLTV